MALYNEVEDLVVRFQELAADKAGCGLYAEAETLDYAATEVQRVLDKNKE